ncbi:MAG: hypothetical protein KAU24_01045 [Candidatus Aenigmarchaeota archaeon]|nr:hypothetical protein [Candidatus Aenigmarchaeota archaeon]
MYIPIHKIAKIFWIKKELGEIYLSKMIECFAISMIGIFIPVYLLKIGFPLYLAIAFMSFTWLITFILSPVSGKVSSIAGFRHTILYRAPIFIIFLLLLIVIEFIPSLFLVALIGGVSLSLYWIPLYAEFVRNTDAIHEGEEVGNLIALPYVAAILAPTIAAIILESLGFPVLFTIAIVLVFLSVVPLFLSSDYKEKAFRLKGFRFFISRRFSLYFFLKGMILAGEFLVWSIFIFLKFGVLILGIAASLSGVGMIILTMLFGRLSNRRGRRKGMIKLGGIFYAVIWIARVFVSTPFEAFILSFLGGLLMAFISIPIFSLFCDFAREKGILDSVVFREMWINLGRFIPTLLIVIILTFTSYPQIFELFFIAAGISSLLFLVVR